MERVEADGCTAVCRGMFQRETDLVLFTGAAQGRQAGGWGGAGLASPALLGKAAKTTTTAPPPHPVSSAGMRVVTSPGGQAGRIEGSFGKSGKFKVFFPGGAPVAAPGQPPPRVLLHFKRFLFDADRRRMAQ